MEKLFKPASPQFEGLWVHHDQQHNGTAGQGKVRGLFKLPVYKSKIVNLASTMQVLFGIIELDY